MYMLRYAALLAATAHAGQTDKAGCDYFAAHIQTVCEMAAANGEDETVQVICLLHDILEDTVVTAEDLNKQFPERVVNAVIAITRQESEPYMDYIQRVKQNPYAKRVKMYDLANNMDIARIPNPTQHDYSRVLRYASAYAELMKI